MTLARALRLVLAAALLAAWQGALVHPLEHVDGHGGLVHLDGKDGKRGSDAQCDALAAVAACVDSRAIPALADATTDGRPQSHAVQSPRGASPPAYRSQAPPQVS